MMHADREVKAVFDEIKDDFSSVSGVSRLADYEVHSYITQIVGGTNYFIKVSAKWFGTKWFHLHVFKVVLTVIDLSPVN